MPTLRPPRRERGAAHEKEPPAVLFRLLVPGEKWAVIFDPVFRRQDLLQYYCRWRPMSSQVSPGSRDCSGCLILPASKGALYRIVERAHYPARQIDGA